MYQLCCQYMPQGVALFGTPELDMHQLHQSFSICANPMDKFVQSLSQGCIHRHLTAKLLPTLQCMWYNMPYIYAAVGDAQ
jgi:hypothetical protein